MPDERVPAPTGDAGVEVAADSGAWTEPYLRARRLEGRLYPDEIVATLPDVPAAHPLAAEWRLRAASAERLVGYLSRIPSPIRVVDVGCGNGWLARRIAGIEGSQVVGLDGNAVELQQARRVFGAVPNLRFVLGEATRMDCPIEAPDAVVLASVIQYIPDLVSLIERLLAWLAPGGEVHILDSPFYSNGEVAAAKARSRLYYERLGVPEMADLYHHHVWSELEGIPFEVVYDPNSLRVRSEARLLRRPRSPFPWIRIRRI